LRKSFPIYFSGNSSFGEDLFFVVAKFQNINKKKIYFESDDFGKFLSWVFIERMGQYDDLWGENCQKRSNKIFGCKAKKVKLKEFLKADFD